MFCNSGQGREHETRYLWEIRKPLQLPATSDRSLAMSRSAVRVRSSALRNKIFRREPPANLHSLDLVAKLLFAEDSYIEALHLYERALVIRKKEAQESNAHD